MKNEFYNKANEYAIGRPTYPEEIIRKIKELDIGNHSTIADIGAGTGLLTSNRLAFGKHLFIWFYC